MPKQNEYIKYAKLTLGVSVFVPRVVLAKVDFVSVESFPIVDRSHAKCSNRSHLALDPQLVSIPRFDRLIVSVLH